jgi:hypothetical protein
MEGDSLYSVKWYKGRREFYRYSPKENPPMKAFQLPGIHVVVSLQRDYGVCLSFNGDNALSKGGRILKSSKMFEEDSKEG